MLATCPTEHNKLVNSVFYIKLLAIQLGSSNKSAKKLTVQSWGRVEGSCSVSCVRL